MSLESFGLNRSNRVRAPFETSRCRLKPYRTPDSRLARAQAVSVSGSGSLADFPVRTGVMAAQDCKYVHLAINGISGLLGLLDVKANISVFEFLGLHSFGFKEVS